MMPPSRSPAVADATLLRLSMREPGLAKAITVELDSGRVHDRQVADCRTRIKMWIPAPKASCGVREFLAAPELGERQGLEKVRIERIGGAFGGVHSTFKITGEISYA